MNIDLPNKQIYHPRTNYNVNDLPSDLAIFQHSVYFTDKNKLLVIQINNSYENKLVAKFNIGDTKYKHLNLLIL